MPQIQIDDKKIEANQGQTIIQAAYANGFEIPHFCWHPELSVAGNCRMCLVEVGTPKRLPDGTTEHNAEGNPIINFIPKLQIACATTISDGMVVRTKSEKSVAAQEAVMEFLLINHPLDCPICDEAGQCKLQEYAFTKSRAQSRFNEEKVHKPKRQIWGPNVIYDGERCIMCSRCIRFAKEVANQDVLTFVQRGDHVWIDLFEGTSFDNPYSMNVIDICPVGALTSRDFRFKSRVWEMSFNDSICPGCARGCNIKAGVRNNQVLRLEPWVNMYVNKYWMCDPGRLTQYKFINENRITVPALKKYSDLVDTEWGDVYEAAASSLSKFKPEEILFIGSGKASTEDNYLLKKFAGEIIKASYIIFLEHADESFADDKLRVSDRNPNSEGTKQCGVEPVNHDILAEKYIPVLRNGMIKAAYVMDDDLADYPELINELKNLNLLIVHTSNDSELSKMADILIASSTYAESEGTFINIDKRVQHFTPAVVTKENMRYMGMKMSRWDKFGEVNDRWTHHEERNCRQSWRSILHIANLMGAGWEYKRSVDVFNEITGKIDAFKNMSYEKLDQYQGLTLGKGDQPDPVIPRYLAFRMRPM